MTNYRYYHMWYDRDLRKLIYYRGNEKLLYRATHGGDDRYQRLPRLHAGQSPYVLDGVYIIRFKYGTDRVVGYITSQNKVAFFNGGK